MQTEDELWQMVFNLENDPTTAQKLTYAQARRIVKTLPGPPPEGEPLHEYTLYIMEKLNAGDTLALCK